jgi:hypothetical protein
LRGYPTPLVARTENPRVGGSNPPLGTIKITTNSASYMP